MQHHGGRLEPEETDEDMANAGDGDKRTVATDALETLGTLIGTGEARDAIHLAVEPVEAGERLCIGEHVGLGADGRAYSADPVMSAGNPGRAVIKALGIVDPFLSRGPMAGERFWLVVFPRQIRSLRHVWEHPDFPAAAPAVRPLAPRSGLTPLLPGPVNELAQIQAELRTVRVSAEQAAKPSPWSVDPGPVKMVTGAPEQAESEEKRSARETQNAQREAREYIEDLAARLGLEYEELMDAAAAYLDDGDYLCDGGRFESEYIPDEFWDHYEAVTGSTVLERERGSFLTCSC